MSCCWLLPSFLASRLLGFFPGFLASRLWDLESASPLVFLMINEICLIIVGSFSLAGFHGRDLQARPSQAMFETAHLKIGAPSASEGVLGKRGEVRPP